MATIDKKLIHFNRLADFEARLAAGDIRDYSIVCIKDAKLIWTHGEYYGDLSECLKVTQQTLTDEEKRQVQENLGIEIPAKVSDLENDKGFVSAVDTGEEVDGVDVTYVTEAAMNAALSGKQENLVSGTNIKTINGESLLGSGNIVIEGGSSSSGGGSGAYVEVNHGTSDTTFTLTPNTFHVWDEVASLDLSFGAETSGVANEYLFQFTSGATATTLTLPDDIKWANEPTIAENMIYQISVLKGLASVLEFSNAAVMIYFTVGSDYGASGTYACEESMTWRDFIDSSYNDGSFSLVSISFLGGEVVCYPNSNYYFNVSPDGEIKDNNAYYSSYIYG